MGNSSHLNSWTVNCDLCCCAVAFNMLSAHQEWHLNTSRVPAELVEHWRTQVQEAHIELDEAGVPASPPDDAGKALTVPERLRLLGDSNYSWTSMSRRDA